MYKINVGLANAHGFITPELQITNIVFVEMWLISRR